jgi:hypothetical protein
MYYLQPHFMDILSNPSQYTERSRSVLIRYNGSALRLRLEYRKFSAQCAVHK